MINSLRLTEQLCINNPTLLEPLLLSISHASSKIPYYTDPLRRPRSGPPAVSPLGPLLSVALGCRRSLTSVSPTCSCRGSPHSCPFTVSPLGLPSAPLTVAPHSRPNADVPSQSPLRTPTVAPRIILSPPHFPLSVFPRSPHSHSPHYHPLSRSPVFPFSPGADVRPQSPYSHPLQSPLSVPPQMSSQCPPHSVPSQSPHSPKSDVPSQHSSRSVPSQSPLSPLTVGPHIILSSVPSSFAPQSCYRCPRSASPQSPHSHSPNYLPLSPNADVPSQCPSHNVPSQSPLSPITVAPQSLSSQSHHRFPLSTPPSPCPPSVPPQMTPLSVPLHSVLSQSPLSPLTVAPHIVLPSQF